MEIIASFHFKYLKTKGYLNTMVFERYFSRLQEMEKFLPSIF